jgi:hypothetical protein
MEGGLPLFVIVAEVVFGRDLVVDSIAPRLLLAFQLLKEIGVGQRRVDRIVGLIEVVV